MNALDALRLQGERRLRELWAEASIAMMRGDARTAEACRESRARLRRLLEEEASDRHATMGPSDIERRLR